MMTNRTKFFPDLRSEAVFGDISSVEPTELLDAAGLKVGEGDLLHGGPPCTPFSKSGYWLEYKRQGADPKASLLDQYVRLLNGTRPKAFLMENVYGLAYRNQNRPVFTRFKKSVKRAGYSLDSRILLAADYGVPQLRQRLFCVGIRNDFLGPAAAKWHFAWPMPSHSGPHETRKGWDEDLLRHVSSGEALADLPAARNPPEADESMAERLVSHFESGPRPSHWSRWRAARPATSVRFRPSGVTPTEP